MIRDSKFWSSIRSALRRKSMFWPPIQACKRNARRAYTGPNKRQKWEHQCASCSGWFKGSEVEVDHVIPAGSLTKSEDLPGFVDRLFCDVSGLRLLCKACHRAKRINS